MRIREDHSDTEAGVGGGGGGHSEVHIQGSVMEAMAPFFVKIIDKTSLSLTQISVLIDTQNVIGWCSNPRLTCYLSNCLGMLIVYKQHFLH